MQIVGDWGSVIMEPISKLFSNLGDAIMNLLQNGIMGMESSGTWVDSESIWSKVLVVVIGVIAAALVVVSAVFTGGVSVAVIVSTGIALLKVLAGTAIAYFAVRSMGIGDDRILCTEF